LIPFLAGAATVLAFAPAGVFPVAAATFAVLIRLWMHAPPRRCFWLGFWFGFGLYGAGVSWVYVSLHTFGGMPAPLAGIATVGFCAFLALFPAMAGWLQARVPAPDPVRACLLIPAAWVLLEWTLEWIFTGFPWLAIGYAAVGWPLQGYAPLGGVYLLSFATVALAGLLWMMVQAQRKAEFILALIAILGIGQALQALRWTAPSGEPVAAALLQGNIEQEMKFSPQRYPAIFDTYARLAEETSAKLIVLPETALPRFYHRIDRAELARLEAAARGNGGDLLLGVPYQQGNDYYNSVITLGVSPSQIYSKAHLVPFGEFIPPGFGWVLQILSIPLSDFSRGSRNPLPLDVAGQRVAVNICYEDVYGDEMAARAADATLLVNVSNVAWFGDSLAPAQHLQIARLRAIESGRMHLTATNTGITAAIDRDGRVLGRLPQFTEARLEVAAQGYEGVTPYVRWRDWPIVLLSLALLAFFIIRARLSPQSTG
jgi:apolipoprotein N-acyltransferase